MARPATTPLAEPYASALARYETDVARSGLGEATRAKYVSRVRAFLLWLAEGDVDGDPLTDPAAAVWAIRDYRAYLKTTRKLADSTLNGTLAALDDFYERRGQGRPRVAREDVTRRTAPRALTDRDTRRYLRAVEQADPRDRAVALLPLWAGLRIGEVVGLDVEDVALSARTGKLRVLGKGSNGGKRREVPIKAELRPVLRAWLDERARWRGADSSPALFLNRRSGGRLTDRAAREIITRLGADLEHEAFGPHVLRHTYATQLVRGGVDPVTVAELLGHASLETTRAYTLPSEDDKAKALDALLVDR
jgi:site-specific recombinase XerD